MDAIDAMTKAQRRPLDDIVLWTALLQEPLDEACDGERDRIDATVEFLEPVIERIAMPRRIADGVRRIVAILPRLAAGKVGRFARNEMLGSRARSARARLDGARERPRAAREAPRRAPPSAASRRAIGLARRRGIPQARRRSEAGARLE